MRIIDTHTHVFPDKVVKRALDVLADPGRDLPYYDGTPRGLLATMKQCRIERSVTLPVATKPSQVHSVNEFATLQAHSSIGGEAGAAGNPLIPFGGIHPDCDDPAAILREFPTRGLIGFKMHPEFQECAPNDPRMEPILETASELGLIAYFHAGRDVGPQTNLGSPRAFAEILDAYPKLKVVLAHFGGFLNWTESDGIAKESVSEILIGRDVWLDTSYTFPDLERETFIAMAEEHDPTKILFGSDGPWVDPMRDIAYLQSLASPDVGWSQEMLEGVFHANAEALFSSAFN